MGARKLLVDVGASLGISDLARFQTLDLSQVAGAMWHGVKIGLEYLSRNFDHRIQRPRGEGYFEYEYGSWETFVWGPNNALWCSKGMQPCGGSRCSERFP